MANTVSPQKDQEEAEATRVVVAQAIAQEYVRMGAWPPPRQLTRDQFIAAGAAGYRALLRLGRARIG